VDNECAKVLNSAYNFKRKLSALKKYIVLLQIAKKTIFWPLWPLFWPG